MPKIKTAEKEVDKREALINLLKAKIPTCLEREVPAAFAMKNVEALADSILEL